MRLQKVLSPGFERSYKRAVGNTVEDGGVFLCYDCGGRYKTMHLSKLAYFAPQRIKFIVCKFEKSPEY